MQDVLLYTRKCVEYFLPALYFKGSSITFLQLKREVTLKQKTKLLQNTLRGEIYANLNEKILNIFRKNSTIRDNI